MKNIYDLRIANYTRLHKRVGRFLWKWLWCSWKHRPHRCYSELWKLDSKVWHCDKCHPCGEFFDILLDKLRDK